MTSGWEKIMQGWINVPDSVWMRIKLEWLIAFKKPIFQRSNIPLFHIRAKFERPNIYMLSVGCKIPQR